VTWLTIPSWLLRSFGSGDRIESLLGDLIEEYRDGRSALWFWYQALCAIVVTFMSEARDHKLLMLRAIAVGWGASLVYASIFYALQPLLLSEMPRSVWVFVMLFIALFGRWLEGTVVAALHRNHRVAAVLAFSITCAGMVVVQRIIQLRLFPSARAFPGPWLPWFLMLMVHLLAIWASLLRRSKRLAG
jgi:hypothetical protein